MRPALLSIAIVWLVAAACDRTRSSTGWDYMPDMYYSQAYESYTSNPNFSDSLTMRVPVQGTVPREMVPFDYENNPEDRAAAGNELVNPLEPTATFLDRGEKAYRYFCLSCHGEKGDGQGYLYTSQRYSYPPASLVSETARTLADGVIYHTITVGYGIMGAHGGMIPPQDRWKIILHIRENLQQ
ncbi:MAG TPA: cytochrome c [Bacteroides sp.]|nr:cytochrome c [Bacteroides sp.]